MAKKRKTRAQKKIADLRHNFSHSIVNQTVFTTKTQSNIQTAFKVPQKSTETLTLESFPYLVKDLSKTGILTLSILAIQIFLYLLLTNHLLKIPGLTY